MAFTPGPCQVLTPLTSLATLAFSLNIEDRRVSPRCKVCPSIGLSQLCLSDHILRGCTIRLMLRPVKLLPPLEWPPILSLGSRYFYFRACPQSITLMRVGYVTTWVNRQFPGRDSGPVCYQLYPILKEISLVAVKSTGCVKELMASSSPQKDICVSL